MKRLVLTAFAVLTLAAVTQSAHAEPRTRADQRQLKITSLTGDIFAPVDPQSVCCGE